MKKFLSRVCLTAVVLTVAAASSAFAASSVKIINNSKWDIHHLYLAPTASDEWGPDQLGDHIIAAGTSFTLNGIPCEKFDVKIVDEDDDECVIEKVSLCNDNAYWKITDKELLACEGDND
ncbi:MAG TPA: hypothetical protein VEZ11_06245 [Thermoanaerobaculia bacterium]|nr:hypothetical protein [Thermoanaerobaculia bacterium]